MPDVLIFNGSASTVQTVAPGTAKKVTGLTDAQISTVAQTAGCVVLRSTTKGAVRSQLGSALRDWKISNDKTLNRME
jgi:hypothetical protein